MSWDCRQPVQERWMALGPGLAPERRAGEDATQGSDVFELGQVARTVLETEI